MCECVYGEESYKSYAYVYAHTHTSASDLPMWTDISHKYHWDWSRRPHTQLSSLLTQSPINWVKNIEIFLLADLTCSSIYH